MDEFEYRPLHCHTPASAHLALLLAYDGTAYYGWQKTKEGPSIEASLEAALSQIFQQPIELQAASRTDRGVHALGQVVDVWVSRHVQDYDRLLISLNSLLPPDIRVRKVTEVPGSFHPTLDVTSKVYTYRVSVGAFQLPSERWTHWHVHTPLDITLLLDASKEFIGTHDFRGFTNNRKDLNQETVRTIFRLDIQRGDQELTFEIEGDHFLYRMCRNIVGTLVSISAGKLPRRAIQEAFQSRKREHTGVTAPSHGLCLMRVSYDHSL